ncbi:hypothetical protein [Qaidamihabitans albus]|uniref:hypothetical protein n=1 Tax=Qaidamihabitans albus TaxID=2795733 RepID=UPI0018F22ED4|nr:hypothetical protein [Qaidamihabitans albus]
MRRRPVILGLTAAGLAAVVGAAWLLARPGGGTGPPPATETPSAPVSAPVVRPPVTGEDRSALAEAVSAAVHQVVPGTEIGLAVHDRRTGSALTGVNAGRQFYAASVVKLLIAIHVLRADEWTVPGGAERDDLVAMLSASADGVASALWDAHGGPAISSEMAGLIGLRHTSPPRIPHQWELTRMSPGDVVAVYEYIGDAMPGHAREFVLAALAEPADPAADGFDQLFGVPEGLPGGGRAVKQGWMRVDDGLVLNSTGLAGDEGRFVVALLTRQPGGTGFAEGRAAVTAGIAALAPTLTADGN